MQDTSKEQEGLIKKNNFWKIRITEKYLKISKIELIEELKKISSDYLIVNEYWDDKGNELPHVQGFIDVSQSERKFRALIKSFLHSGGNQAFSMDNRHSDWNGYKGYLLKYADTDIIGTSYGPDDITYFKEYYKKVSKPKPKPRKDNILDNDLNQILSTIDLQGTYSILEISNIVVKYFKDNSRVLHRANCQQLVWSVHTALDHKDELDFALDIINNDDGLRNLYNKQENHFNCRDYDEPA